MHKMLRKHSTEKEFSEIETCKFFLVLSSALNDPHEFWLEIRVFFLGDRKFNSIMWLALTWHLHVTSTTNQVGAMWLSCEATCGSTMSLHVLFWESSLNNQDRYVPTQNSIETPLDSANGISTRTITYLYWAIAHHNSPPTDCSVTLQEEKVSSTKQGIL